MVVGYYIHFRMFDGYEAAEEPETKEKTSLKDFGTSLIQNPPLIALLIACISPYVYVFVTSGIAIYYFQPVGNRKNAAGWITGLQMVPFLAYSKRMREGGRIPDQDTFAVIGASVAENFSVAMPEHTIGKSILQEWLR